VPASWNSRGRDAVRADFDRIARLLKPSTPHAREARLLARIPAGARILDVGCGAGDVAEALAARAERVIAVDFSHEMVVCARSRLIAFDHVEVIEADFMELELEAEAFDAVVSFATLHHLPYEAALERMARVLHPGGILLVQDLFDATGLREFPYNVASYLLNLTRLRPSALDPAIRAAWRDHAHHDQFMTLREIRERVGRTLPGAVVRRVARSRAP